MRLVYVIGDPGSGKSTAVAEALADTTPVTVLQPVPDSRIISLTEYWTDLGEPVVVEPGAQRSRFSGTDALPMNIMPVACRWIAMFEYPLVLAEGDRLASPKFWDAAACAGYDLTIVHLATDPSTSAARRDARGSRQNPSWLAGRRTKTLRLADAYADVTLNGQLPVADIGAQLRKVLNRG